MLHLNAPFFPQKCLIALPPPPSTLPPPLHHKKANRVPRALFPGFGDAAPHLQGYGKAPWGRGWKFFWRRGRNRPATLATQTPEITFPDKVSNSFEHRILTSPDRTFPSGRGKQCTRSSCQKVAPRDGGPVC